MSQATQSVPLRQQLAAHRLLAVSALLALLATAAVVLVMTIGGESTKTTAAAGQSTYARVLWNGRPADSVPAPVGSQTSSGPDESRIAASIGSTSEPATAGRPDESGIAASIGSADKPSPKVGETKVSPSIRH